MARLFGLALIALTAFFAEPALAAEAHGLDDAKLTPLWGVPFAGLLLSIAIFPLVAPAFWHRHYGKVTFAWAATLVLPLAAFHGVAITAEAVLHAVLTEYLPFILLLFALFTIAGGILVSGEIRGTPAVNTAMLLLGTASASIVGTTGASMILIRPILRANGRRRHNVHVVVFFIFLVANIGGALSPLGDPPLFIGFLHGVDFFWTTKNLALPTTIVALLLLAIFFALDSWLFAREPHRAKARTRTKPLRICGSINFLLLAGVIAALLLSAAWKPGVAFTLYGVPLEGQDLARDVILLALAGLSLWLTRDEHRAGNEFSWEPIKEVAKLFAGIFIAIIPVIAMLKAGREGPFAWLLAFVTEKDGSPHEAAYFWVTGILSAALDNAPTYLVFFELAGGKADELMGGLGPTLAAISMGAVFMGALTYIGNAPNFMVRAIAEERGIKMPSFFGFIGWSALFLLPVFLILSWLQAWL